MELIAAIETAAVARVRNRPGSDQNGDLKAYMPAKATEIRPIAT